MIKRLLLLVKSKIQSLFLNSMSFSSRIEFSDVSRKAKVWGKCKLYFSSIDDNSYIGRNSRLIHAHVGKFCSIGGGSSIGMGTHSIDYISTSPLFIGLTLAIWIPATMVSGWTEDATITFGFPCFAA